MAQPVNSLTELIAVLQGAIKTNPEQLQFIVIDGSLFPEAGTFAGFVGRPVTITQIKDQPLLTSDATSVTLKGTSPLFSTIEYDVELTGTVPAKTPLLKMVAGPSADQQWSFAKEFPGLPPYTGSEDGRIKEKPSFFNTIVINDPVFTVSTFKDTATKVVEGLSLAGALDATAGDLEPLKNFIPNAGSLPLSGTIAMRTAPAFALIDFVVAAAGLNIPKVTDVTLALAATNSASKDSKSLINFAAQLSIPGLKPIAIDAPLLQGDSLWAFRIMFPDGGLTLSSGVSQLSGLVSGYPLALPSDLEALSWVGLQEIVIGIIPPESLSELPTLQSVGVTVGTTQKWNLPIPGMSIGDLATQWIIISPLSDPILNGEVRGTIFMGSGEDAPRLNVEIDLPAVSSPIPPAVEISADLDTRFPVRLGQVFKTFTGGAIDLDLNISQLDLIVIPSTRNLFVYCVLDGDWPFPVPQIKFTQLNFYIEYSPNSISGSATVAVTIAGCDFAVTAAHPGPNKGWQFNGGLLPGQSIKVVDFFKNLLPQGWPGLPDSLRGLEITKFAFFFDTLSKDYKFQTALVWKFELADRNWTVDADFLFAATHVNGKTNYSGAVSGSISVNAFKVSVAYEFNVQNSPTLTFRIQYNSLSLTCKLTTNEKKQTILTANLGGVTFGGIVEYLVNLVDPNLGFRLSPPWDLLYEINFDSLTLTVNLTTKEVGVSYTLDKDLGLIYVKTIGLAYVNKAGRKTVDITITGRFFEQTYKEENPLGWDLINDPPPTPPGKGDQLLDLRYLGVGQNVGFRDARNFDSVQSVIKALQADFLPVDGDQNPLLSPALDKLKFTGDGNWLIGADFTLIEAISLMVVFNDPVLYGLRIALSGEKVKSFSGLDFQILYKKVTDTIGVYHVVLTLPDAFRQLQFGAVSVTLPVITIDIYTNGNFRIDMGFPVGLDFSKSFCVQAGPFIGYGGFYFAVLNGATSTRVPRITNGNFSPVIEAGVALSVGLGRTIDKGVLSAGVTVTMVTIIEGAFGWFNPYDRSVGTALFYRIQGSAAIVGKLYGKVNFVVIQAEVNVTAFAKVTLTMESYKPIIVVLSLGVEISVSIKILFFRVSFSFSATLDLSFTIGSASTPPWIIDSSQPAPLTLRQQLKSRPRLSGAILQEQLLPLLLSPGTFDWKPRSVFAGIQHVELSIVPALTVALSDKVFATHTGALGAVGQPQHQIVMSLFAPNSVPVESRNAKAVRTVTMTDAAASPFNLLVSGMLKWALASYTRPAGVMLPPPSEYTLASDLDAISNYLADPQKWQDVFTYDALAAFMELNYVLDITTPLGPSGLMHPQGLLKAGEAAPEVSAAIFPMIPDLEMGPKGMANVQFWNYHCIDRDYENALTEYYRQLRIQSGPAGTTSRGNLEDRPKIKLRQTPGPVGCDPGFESLSTFIFRDYFAMLAKGAVNSATDLLKSYPYEPTGSTGSTGGTGPTGPPESLRSIADEFNGIEVEYRTRPGDTLGLIAGRFGIAPQAIQSVNLQSANFKHQENLPAGMALRINTGVTPVAIANQNADYPLHYVPSNPVWMNIDGVQHQVKSTTGGQSESLLSVSSQYGITGPTGPGSLFTYFAPDGNPNASNDNLLRPGATFTIPQQLFKVSSSVDDTRALVAAFFFVRSLGEPQPSQTPWYTYVQFYSQWIEDHGGSDSMWEVPIVTVEDGTLSVTGTRQYAPQGVTGSDLAPDTRELAAAYFAMTQLSPAPFGEAFRKFQSLVSPTGPPQTYSIAQFPYTVQPGDTVEKVAQRFGINLGKLADVNANTNGLLQPLAVMALPTLNYPIGKDDTLGSVAAQFDLTLDNLVDSVERDPGILKPYGSASTPLNIPELPGRPTEKLLDDLVNLGRFNDVSGLVTRFLVHGMRVPEPESAGGTTFPAGTPLWGLYEMAGQQFPVPAGASGPSGEFNVKFTKGATADWICFKPAGPSGITGPTGCEGVLVVHLDPPFFQDVPSLVLDPQLLVGPGPLPLYRDTPKQYSLQENIHWQSATFVPLPGPTGQSQQQAGQPSIWNFPPTLRQIALQGPTGPTAAPQYQLVKTDPGDQTGDSDAPVSHYSWAATIELRVQRVPTNSGEYLPNSYLLLGADQDGRDQLLSAWNFLEKVQPPYGKLFILYPPSVTSNNSTGLASQSVDSEQTFLLKTNLTTVTQSNQPLLAAKMLTQPSGDFYARLDAIPDFLRLAWEASITGSGGFYLNYVTSNGRAGLPESLFANGNVASVTLLILTAPQMRSSRPDLVLYPFNNCAVIGDNVDPNSAHLYARALSGNQVRIASVPAGQAGFYMARRNPDPGATGSIAPTGPADQTRNLYNLAGYQIADNKYFAESNQGLPVGPAETPVHGVSGPTGPGVWWYQQVLPISRFGKTNNAPSSLALPPTAENPYAGITGQTGGALSEMNIALGFVDVYGNQTVSTVPSLSVTGPVGYIDDLIGVSSWPGAGADFAFTSGPNASVVLDTRISLQVDKYSPSSSYGFEQSSTTATADARHYAQIFYQVQQQDLTFDLQTNLGALQTSADELKAPLAAFVSKAKVFADSCASQRQQEYVTKEDDQLEAIASAFSITLSSLVNENQNVRVAQLFQGKIVDPTFKVAGPMNTLDLLVENQLAAPYPPVCGPGGPPDCGGPVAPTFGVCSIASPDTEPKPLTAIPDDDTPLTVAQLLTQNRTVPLTPGLVLRTLARVSPLPEQTPNTLAAVAAKLECVVYGVVEDPETKKEIEIGLFSDNYTAGGVVAPNLDIKIDSVIINTGATPTLKSVEEAFDSLGLDQADFAVKLQSVPGIFAPASRLTHANLIIPQPPVSGTGQSVPVYSIDNVPKDCGTIEFLATTNRIVPNFFYTGSPLYMRSCCYQPTPFDTFASLAEQFNHITLDQLAQFNAAASLNADVSLAIPALTYLDKPASLYAAYSPATTDSLNTIAQMFRSTAQSVAAINENLPGIFAPGVTVKVGTDSFKPGPLDSLKSAADGLHLTFDKFVSGVAGETKLYRTNGVIIAPLPQAPDDGSGKSAALTVITLQLNLQPAGEKAIGQLLSTNRALEKFLQQGASFAGPIGSKPIEARAHDTVNTIINRFQREQQLTVTIEQLATANAATAGLLTLNQPFLLPPNATNIAIPLTPVIPPKGAAGEQAVIFPVNVSLEMKRGQHLVAPDFRKATAVFQNKTDFAPRAAGVGTSSVSLTNFAEQFEQAFENHRLKCGSVQRESLSSSEQSAQLFAVNFGPGGISRLVVEATEPQFYALAPLSTQLLTGNLPIRPYKSGCGLEPRVFKQFDSVDLDSWMAQFLNTVDLFLTAPYAVPAFQMPGGPTGGVAAEPLPADGPVGLAQNGPLSFFSSATGCTGGTAINGPGNYDDIVAAKEGLAEQLSLDVLPIIHGAGATGNYDNGIARETLTQQMLVQLSDAYTVNAIVQYPVDVQSPCVTPISPTGATGPLPPRLSGKIVPDLYVTPKPNDSENTAVSLNEVATVFSVSVPFLAETIGGAHGLLETGATATYDSRSFVIQQSDTLNVVANNLGVSTDPDQSGYWEKWTTFATAIASQPLLVAGDSFPVVKIARRVYQTDTIETMAEFFGVDAATVGQANQSCPGIFQQITLTLDGYEDYPIKKTDTLLTVAAAIKPKTGNPPLTVETLSLKVSSFQKLLAVGQTLYLTQVLPDITMSTTKVSLGRVGSVNGLKPLLSFLLTVKHPRQFRKLFLNLKYVVNEVEFGIRNVPGASGYQASSWLTFILPLGSDKGAGVGVMTDMAQVQIPIPLRSYPVPPTLVSQSGLPTDGSIETQTPEQAIMRGKEWDYRFDFQSANAAQDTNHVELVFNPFSPNGLFKSNQSRVNAVFAALAEFMDAYPQLISDLARLPRLAPGASDPTAAIAVMVLDSFATNVANALKSDGFTLALAGARWPELKYLYKLETSVVKDELAELHLVMESGPTGPVGAGPIWPQVLIQSLTGLTGSGPDAGFLPLQRFGPTAGIVANYKYPGGFPATDMVTQRFLLPARDVIQNQNASAGIYLTRNDDLIASGPLGSQGPTGPSGPRGPIATNSAFLYQTPMVKFINPLTPFLTVGESINVAGLSGPSGPAPFRKLSQHIENMLDAVLEFGDESVIKADSKISILCSYGFPVAGGVDELTATIPVRLVPAQFLTPELKSTFAFKLSKSIQSWPGWPGAGGTGALIFDLSVFTAPGVTGQSETLKPILEFENLRVRLVDVVPGQI